VTFTATFGAGPREGMLVATKTTTVRDEDGAQERLTADTSFVQAGHWLTTRYPDLFVPGSEWAKYHQAGNTRSSDGRGDWRGQLNLPASDDRPKWKPLVRFQDWAEPTFTIRLTRQAFRDMADLAYAQRLLAYRNQAPVNETGGALYGVPAGSRDTTVTISGTKPYSEGWVNRGRGGRLFRFNPSTPQQSTISPPDSEAVSRCSAVK
jgi:hypothetical protein